VEDNPAQAFVDYLDRHSALRETLRDGVLEDIIAAGAARGYFFTASDLERYIRDHQKTGESSKWTQ
jgi:hypothetical protein